MFSASDTKSHNPQDRPGQLWGGVAPHTPLLVLFTFSTGLVVHLDGLTGSRKVISESILGYLYPYAWYALTVRECSFNIKL